MSLDTSNKLDTMTAEVLQDDQAFERLRGEWDELLTASEQQAYFLRWHWTKLWWSHFAPPDSRLHLVTCRDSEGTLVGLAPFYWRQRRIATLPYVREILFIGMGIELKTSEHLDVIARRGYERVVAREIAAVLLDAQDWDRLWLWQVPAQSRILNHLQQALGASAAVRPCDRAPYIDTSAGWAAFKQGFGRSMRRNVEYYPRRLFKTYSTAAFSHVTTPEELEPALDALVTLHRAWWRSRGEAGAFDQSFETFLRQAARQSLAEGQLRLWTITIEGRIEAALIGFLDNGVLHYFQKGINPAFAKDDLGTSLLALSIRHCCDDPCITGFDFMGGGAPYKDMWARLSRENVLCELRRSNWRTWTMNTGEAAGRLAHFFFATFTPEALRAARRDVLKKRRMRKSIDASGPVALAVTVWEIACDVLPIFLLI
jgi:CelD/BcsL family acetyltransferase involved in cellulose biosynthesis